MTTHDVDLLRELVDHQVVDDEGEARGKVDDLVLEVRPEGLEVTALLTGVEPWAERLDRPVSRWLAGLARFLDSGAACERIGLGDIDHVDSAVHLRRGVEVRDGVGERWLSQHVIGRLPGGRHEP